MRPDRLLTMTDRELWEFLLPRLPPPNSWEEFLVGPAAERIRTVLVQQLRALEDGTERSARSRGDLRRLAQLRMPQVNIAVKRYHVEQNRLRDQAEDKQLVQALRLLTLQVVRHQSVLTAAGMEPTATDETLWQSLDWIKVRYGEGQESLARIVELDWGADLIDDEQ